MSISIITAAYRLRTGEQTMALQRGPLSPVSIPHTMNRYPQQSNFGTDLAILNKDFGILDLTYQLSWQLGRTVAMSNGVFVGDLLRLRTEVHEKVHGFCSRKTVLQKVSGTIANLQGADNELNGGRKLQFAQRWQKLSLDRSLRSQLSLRSTEIQQDQAKVVPVRVYEKAQSENFRRGHITNSTLQCLQTTRRY